MVVHGGGTTGNDASSTFIKQVGSLTAPIVVLGQTSETPIEKGQKSADLLKENGAKNVYISTVTETSNASLPEPIDQTRNGAGVLDTGRRSKSADEDIR